MSEPLEPTEEQRMKMISAGCDGRYVDAVFNLVRDLVLEAAAEECEVAYDVESESGECAWVFAATIRGLKGTP